MTHGISAIRGMNDILPEEVVYWQFIEQQLRALFASYGYIEIRPPLLERTEVFSRSIGVATDIVAKEMYTFSDRNGENLTLRPEGTAGCVRAVIEHHLAYKKACRFWMMGPMFRYERPQKGRYRQFYQVGVEALGLPGPDIDAELIFMSQRLWRQLGLSDDLVLQLNSLGDSATREKYREVLKNYFITHYDQLDEDSKKRLETNPLRILDSKNRELETLIQDAPKITQFLDETSRQNLKTLEALLTEARIRFVLNSRLVRGLDYYDGMVFEWETQLLGAQGAVCGGGRYNGLVECLGGESIPAVGFAIGMERLVEVLKAKQTMFPICPPDVYIVRVGERGGEEGLLLAEYLRDELPFLKVLSYMGEGGFKQQLRQADKSGARIALILGETEIASGKVSLKFLREEKPQQIFSKEEIKTILMSYFS
ncbi:MAG: histidine--tRNA ligase [Gammaproteobacteria bacterium]|nr:histidine--tRNA ligase [Gammaproteobacteria bacterium]